MCVKKKIKKTYLLLQDSYMTKRINTRTYDSRLLCSDCLTVRFLPDDKVKLRPSQHQHS